LDPAFLGKRAFRFFVDGNAVTNPSPNVTADEVRFALVNTNNNTHMSALILTGTGKLDDLQITEAGNPLDNIYPTVRAVAGTTGGSLTPIGDTSVISNSNVDVVITPDSGYFISSVTSNGVTVDVGSNTNGMTYPLTGITAALTTVTGTFAEVGTTLYEITVVASENGSISPSTVSVPSGNDQPFAITPSNNYAVASVVVDGTNMGAITTYTFTNVTAAHSIAATFDYAYTSDGIPHWWIDQFGITPDDTASTNDVDGDGEDLYNEWLKSTHPNDADSYLQIIPWEQDGTNYIQWFSPAIDPVLPPFIVLGSTNLLDTANWEPLDSTVSRSATNTWSQQATGTRIFYRVAVTNAP
jgi:hypothetical protein